MLLATSYRTGLEHRAKEEGARLHHSKQPLAQNNTQPHWPSSCPDSLTFIAE